MRRLPGKVDAFLVTRMPNVRYLSGFTGSSGFLLVTPGERLFVTDSRYALQAREQVDPAFTVLVEKRAPEQAVRALARRRGVRSLGVESSISYEFYRSLEKSGIALRACKGVVEKLRMRKDEEEMRHIREAVRRAEAAFEELLPHVRPGAVERALALRLEDHLRLHGSRRVPFDAIVASGPNSAKPHWAPGSRKLAPGDLVVIDWGGEADGYCSDMTRTVLLRGKDTAPKEELYRLVLDANRRGIAAVKAEERASRIDKEARDVIKNAGYAEFFGHALGHGVGLEVHELPRISGRSRRRVREGMVFTVEPGVYVPGLGGVRIEDMVLVGRDGREVLTSLPVELRIL
ncbi:MAG: aminopeptidase P family protein [Nitrospirota bacterium]